MKKIVVLFGLLAAASVSAQPYQPTAIWQREGAGDSSLYGSEILALGDQDNDGSNDWAVYAAGLGYAPPGSPNEPIVEFFHGGNPPDTIPYMVRVKDPATELAVRGARALGDLNGDGYVDWGIFTSYWDGTEDRPQCKVYFGGPSSHETPDLVVPITWVYPIGDFNGDGYHDIYLSAGVVLYGGDPMDLVPDWIPSVALALMSGIGDVNQDGFSDFVTSNNAGDAVLVFLGATNPNTLPEYQWSASSYFPAIVADVNGDSYDELCLDRTGAIGWGQLVWGGTQIDTSQYVRLDFPCSGSRPFDIASAGDFNADGYGDVVMLREYCPNWYYGVLTLHLGHPWTYSEPAIVLHGWTEPLNLIHFGTAIALGDVNGDGIDDLAVGARGGIEYLAQRGKVVVLRGDDSLIADAPEPPRPLPQTMMVMAYPNPFNSSTTLEMTLPISSQDVNLAVYNLLGQEVFATRLMPAGGKVLYRYDASELSTGLYLLHVSFGSLHSTTKLMVLK